MNLKNTFGALALVAVLGSCSKDEPKPAATPPVGRPVRVMVSEAGAPSYELRDALVTSANYQSSAAAMEIIGKLNSGKVLTLSFSKNGTAQPYSTNTLEAALDGNSGSAASGTTTYSTQSQRANGSFRVTFPVIGEVTGTFTGAELP
ncbi:hypothetical protein GCM10023185_08210 [Hymenobacter saemangeumensis]|uniref:Uncharacterized protein n=1 Tax=Hymenobacter saemangeumensis TaxID=1084522 RepID=A0ABP8I370_9BACT